MQPDLVADVGNTRIKWGRCDHDKVAELVSLAADDEVAWERQLQVWHWPGPRRCVVAGVHPRRCRRLGDWLHGRGERTVLLERAAQIPLQVRLEHPDRVGIDRLLNAVAANTRRCQGQAAAIVDAGSAVTVDYLDETGAFRGGAIFPGLRLMARSLNDYTALLPAVEVQEPAPLPGITTTAAIQAGVYWAVVGGVIAIVQNLRRQAATVNVYITGGDAALLAARLPDPVVVWPEMTLEGIRISAAALATPL
jgi:type III pantothenate kinase